MDNQWVRSRQLLLFASLALLAVSTVQVVLTGRLVLAGSTWEAISAIGTVGATGVAVWLAGRSLLNERGAVARLVSAWVTQEFHPREDGRTYQRVTVLNVGNESNEPVFEAWVNVLVGYERVQLGPLSAPSPIAVLAPRSVRQFDISPAIVAQLDTADPRAELTFTDPSGARWHRSPLGRLSDVTKKKTTWATMPDPTPEQVGKQDPFNPLVVSSAFLATLWEAAEAKAEGRVPGPEMDPSVAVATFASGWADANWAELGRTFVDFTPTNFVEYPAGHLAYVRLVGDPALQGKRVSGPGQILVPEVRYMTLVLDDQAGWRVFGIGAKVEPDQIEFPDETLSGAVRSGGGSIG